MYQFVFVDNLVFDMQSLSALLTGAKCLLLQSTSRGMASCGDPVSIPVSKPVSKLCPKCVDAVLSTGAATFCP
jgi:hypothetical protein